jgi:hypothetical protein
METIDSYFGNFSKIDKIVFKTCIMIFIILLFSGCMATKKTSDKETATTSSTTQVDTKKDEEKTTTNEAIKDNIVINVPESNNAEAMRMFNEMMKQMNSSKSSGSNSYNSRYDEENRKWIIDFIVAQTENKEKSSESDKASTSDTTFDQKVDDYIKKIVIPWWMYLIGGYFLFLALKPLLMIIFPQLSVISGLLGKKK